MCSDPLLYHKLSIPNWHPDTPPTTAAILEKQTLIHTKPLREFLNVLFREIPRAGKNA